YDQYNRNGYQDNNGAGYPDYNGYGDPYASNGYNQNPQESYNTGQYDPYYRQNAGYGAYQQQQQHPQPTTRPAVRPAVQTRKPKAKTASKILIGVAVGLGVLLVGAGIAIVLVINHLDELLTGGFTPEEKADLEQVLVSDVDETLEPFYALLLGIDSYDINSNSSRADVVILCRIDVPNNTITMVSIPRDTMINFTWKGRAYGYVKINAAYAYGKEAGMVQAVSDFAGVKIAHVGVVSFSGLEEIIDAAGGVDIDAPVSMNQPSSMDSRVRIMAGEQHLTGHEALCFARERKAYGRGDFQRADNQKIVAQAFIRSVLSLNPVGDPLNPDAPSMYSVIEKLCEIARTDLSVTRLVSMARVMNVGALVSYNAIMPGKTYGYKPAGSSYTQSYVVTYYADWKNMLQNIDLGRDPYSEEEYDGPDTVFPIRMQVIDASEYSGGMPTE
ncbi:MAG: LCP family protein, partial [Eggerthellaceae bacterium]|nr:LCP family protein [Eggerthellaceae bacterium]